MLYVLFGQDTYRSRKKLQEIADRFYTVAGGRESVVRIVVPESSRFELEQVLTTGSLFRSKRLFIVEEPSDAPADAVAYLEEQLPMLAKSDDIYVIWDRIPASAKAGFITAGVAHAAKAQEFGQLGADGAARFLDGEAHARGITLNSSEKRHILTNAGGDSWRMIQQLEKSALAKESSNAGVSDATVMDMPADRALFSLLDAYGLLQGAKAWQIYIMLVRFGVEPDKIFWRVLSHTKTILSIYSLIQRGVAMADIPREAGVHPFVVKKIALTAARMPMRELTRRYTALVSLDFQTKQSRGDLTLGLERILLSL